VKIHNERFTIPEVLFNPQDIGINEAGIPEMISQTIAKCPSAMEHKMYENILVSGGNANLRGFAKRIQNDIVAPGNSRIY
jgi:actin-related protein 6